MKYEIKEILLSILLFPFIWIEMCVCGGQD